MSIDATVRDLTLLADRLHTFGCQLRAESNIVDMYVDGGLSTEEVTETCGVSSRQVVHILKRHGVLRSPSESVSLAWQRKRAYRAIMQEWKRSQISVGDLITLLAKVPTQVVADRAHDLADTEVGTTEQTD